MCLKEVTVLWYGRGYGSVSADQRRSGEELHLCFDRVQNNWLGASTRLHF